MGYQILRVYYRTWMKGRFKISLIGILGLLLLVVSLGCSEKSGKPVSGSIPIIVSTVTQKAVPVQIRAMVPSNSMINFLWIQWRPLKSHISRRILI